MKKQTLNLSMIACVNQKLALGKDNKLLYYLPSDLKHFKMLTTNNVIIMGKNTYESLPIKPLPNRINIVLTSDKSIEIENGHTVSSIQECLDLCYKLYKEKKIYIIGGASIYSQFLDLGCVQEIVLTYVKDDADGDVFFPDIFHDDRYGVIDETLSKPDEKDEKKYTILTFGRKKP